MKTILHTQLLKVHSCNVEEVSNYLPSNFEVIGFTLGQDALIVAGIDNHGWTVDEYVIPRLGSGLIHAERLEHNETISVLLKES